MRKLYYILFFTLFLCSCRTGSNEHLAIKEFQVGTPIEEQLETVFQEYRSYEGSVCMGLSGPFSDKTAAIHAATERCLQMISLHEGLLMKQDIGMILGNIETKSAIDTVGGASGNDFSSLASKMEIVDIKWYGGKIGAVVFARLPEFQRIKWEKEIDWISFTPQIEGYNVVVATSQKNYSNVCSSLEAAAFRAAELVLETNENTITVNNSISSYVNDSYLENTYQIKANILDGFMILDYRYDKLNNRVYTLAISK